jgi:hypothetical protein
MIAAMSPPVTVEVLSLKRPAVTMTDISYETASGNLTPSQVVVEAPSPKRPAVTMTDISLGTASGNPTKLNN